jgi:hypothetical protein
LEEVKGDREFIWPIIEFEETKDLAGEPRNI